MLLRARLAEGQGSGCLLSHRPAGGILATVRRAPEPANIIVAAFTALRDAVGPVLNDLLRATAVRSNSTPSRRSPAVGMGVVGSRGRPVSPEERSPTVQPDSGSAQTRLSLRRSFERLVTSHDLIR